VAGAHARPSRLWRAWRRVPLLEREAEEGYGKAEREGRSPPLLLREAWTRATGVETRLG